MTGMAGGKGIPFSSPRGRTPLPRGQTGRASSPAAVAGSEAANGPGAWPARRGVGERARLGEGPPGETRAARPSRARPTGSRVTGPPCGTRLRSWEAAQHPQVRAAWRARLQVPAESRGHFPRQPGRPPRGTSFEAALAGTKGGAVQPPGSGKT